MTTAQQELADQIEQSCHVTIEHGLVGGTILTKDKLDMIVTALRAHDDMLDALRDAELQIEYLNKFGRTGTGEAVLAKIRAAIAKATGQS